MVPVELLEKALKSGKELYSFAQGGEFYLLLNELAGIEGQTASRAIDDAMKSKYSRGQLNQAEGILRLAYEKYSRAANPSFFSNVVSAVIEPMGPLKSRNKSLLNAATTALTAAEVTRGLYDAFDHNVDSFNQAYLAQSPCPTSNVYRTSRHFG